MWGGVLILALMQSVMLSVGQLFLKFALDRLPAFSWTWDFWGSAIVSWRLGLSGILVGSATLMGVYMVKKFPLSMAIPLSSMSYGFTLILAWLFLQEQIPLTRWIGVFMIMCGCMLVTAKY